ncbi:MAG: alkaline phosphatase family protein [Mycobacterium sp.]|nr:alkaline phosphatase family protein [Mycobacterium sp.]
MASSTTSSVYADWQYINDIAGAGGYAADVNKFVAFDTTWEDTDNQVVDATIARIVATTATDSSFIFSYQVAVDEAGHAAGGGSPEYADAVVNTSENIKRIMVAVDAWETDPDNLGEEWTVIVTTDHGHQQSVGFGHGFQSPNETSSFVIFDLEGDSANDGKQNLGYSNADITPTIVSLFNVPLRSDFDGVSLVNNKTDSIVTPADLKQALNDAVAMYGYPNIGTDLALGVRTVFASVPYFLGIITNTITAQLQAIVDADIFLISPLVGLAEFVVQVTGDVLVATTQAVARVVATLTGAGTIPPSDLPLPAPSAGSVRLPMLPAAALV